MSCSPVLCLRAEGLRRKRLARLWQHPAQLQRRLARLCREMSGTALIAAICLWAQGFQRKRLAQLWQQPVQLQWRLARLSSGGVLPQLSQGLAQAPSGEALATSAQLWQHLAQLWHLWALRLRPWGLDRPGHRAMWNRPLARSG